MQQIVLSGTLLTDAEKCTDRNGRSFVRFTITCGSNDKNGRTIYTHYRCTCYANAYENMKKGDQVFLSGRLSASIEYDKDNQPYLSLNVMVYQISGGYRANERENR